jgi:hypothetical protein
MERFIKAKEILVRGWRTGGYSVGRMVDRLVGFPRGCVVGLQATFWLTVSVLLISCTTLKKAAIVSSLGTTGALVGNAVSGTAGLIVGGVTTAAVADIATETMIGTKGSGDMSSCAPDNFWSLLGSLVEMGGFLLLGVVLIPMLLGWFLPGPVKLKGRDKKPTNPYLR